MKNNWKLSSSAWGTAQLKNNFDDYGHGEYHSISIGDEIESSDKNGHTHYGVVVGIIRDINEVPVCYKIWDEEHCDFDYVQAMDSIVCEPCGSSQWALERIGYTKFCLVDDDMGFYQNERTGDVIYW